MKSPNMNSPCILTILTLLVLWIILEVPTVSSHNECSNPDVATNTTCPTNDSNATTLLWNTPWTSEDLYKELDCDNVFSTERPIHSSAVWIYLQALYIGIVGPTNSSIALVSTSSSLYQSGFFIPYEVRHSPGKGRGIFATDTIPQHTRIWTSRNTARFTSGDSYRRFLLSMPADLACDVMEWAYVEEFIEDVLEIGVDLDDGSLTNSGGCRGNNLLPLGGWVDGEDSNIGDQDDCEGTSFALREIVEGEEILIEYASFEVEDGWEEFGL